MNEAAIGAALSSAYTFFKCKYSIVMKSYPVWLNIFSHAISYFNMGAIEYNTLIPPPSYHSSVFSPGKI